MAHHQTWRKTDTMKERLYTKVRFLEELRRDLHADLFKLLSFSCLTLNDWNSPCYTGMWRKEAEIPKRYFFFLKMYSSCIYDDSHWLPLTSVEQPCKRPAFIICWVLHCALFCLSLCCPHRQTYEATLFTSRVKLSIFHGAVAGKHWHSGYQPTNPVVTCR